MTGKGATRGMLRNTKSYNTYLEYHTAQLCSEQQLLSLRDQRINDKMLLHICRERHVSQTFHIRLPTMPVVL